MGSLRCATLCYTATLLHFHSVNKASNQSQVPYVAASCQRPSVLDDLHSCWLQILKPEIARGQSVCSQKIIRKTSWIFLNPVFWIFLKGLSLWNTWDIPVALILSTSRSVQIVSRRAWRDIKISHHGSGTDLHISTPSTLVKHLAIACGTLQSPRAGVA